MTNGQATRPAHSSFSPRRITRPAKERGVYAASAPTWNDVGNNPNSFDCKAEARKYRSPLNQQHAATTFMETLSR